MSSLYTLFHVTPSSHPSDVVDKYHKHVRRLTIHALKDDFQRRGWGTPPPKLIDAMHNYLQSAAFLLADPSSNEIYRAWEKQEPGVVDRMNWFNKHSKNPVFGSTCFDNQTSTNIMPAPPKRSHISTTCRWCAQPFDMPASALYKCKCGGWAGHRACGEAFAREYQQKCPICRTNLLPRDKPSKYMFWSVEPKYRW